MNRGTCGAGAKLGGHLEHVGRRGRGTVDAGLTVQLQLAVRVRVACVPLASWTEGAETSVTRLHATRVTRITRSGERGVLDWLHRAPGYVAEATVRGIRHRPTTR
jgi:hypothetical protein